MRVEIFDQPFILRSNDPANPLKLAAYADSKMRVAQVIREKPATLALTGGIRSHRSYFAHSRANLSAWPTANAQFTEQRHLWYRALSIRGVRWGR